MINSIAIIVTIVHKFCFDYLQEISWSCKREKVLYCVTMVFVRPGTKSAIVSIISFVTWTDVFFIFESTTVAIIPYAIYEQLWSNH